MVSMMNYSGSSQELKLLGAQIKELAAHYSEDKWDLHSFSELKELEKFLDGQPIVNLSCYDVTKSGSLEYLHKIREVYRKMYLMLIADWKMSPMDYIKPDILASELILRPYKSEELKNKLYSLISSYLDKEEEGDVFILDTKEEKIRIPYLQIYYIEACDKKIYVRLKREEKGFYGTLESLEGELPEYFVRCHRSFLVNWNFVEKILRSQNLLILSDGMKVPFSRSYKAKIIERMR